MLIDTHCHLDFPELASDLDAILQRAKDAGVKQMITISTRIREFEKLRAIIDMHDNIFCTIGTHPHNAGEPEEQGISAEEIAAFAQHPKVVGIGEAGLDYHYDHAPRGAQAAGFRAHIEAARLTNLPIVIHARSADQDMADLLEQEMSRAPFAGVMHCFSSGLELARRALAIGLYISFSGILTFKNAKDVQAAALEAPEDRILVETDAPYLAPVPHRGARNEPSYVADTARLLAALRGKSRDEMARITTKNAYALFTRLPQLKQAEAA